MAVLPNVTSFYLSSTGELLGEVEGSTTFHAQSNNANLILINLEDGALHNSTAFVNFTPRVKAPYTTHWFYSSYQGIVEKSFGGVVKSFAQYALLVPKIVLQNHTTRGVTQNDLTIIQRYGSNHLGVFTTLADLEIERPLVEIDVEGYAITLELLEDGYPASANNGLYGLVTGGPDIGFYQSNGTEWLPITTQENAIYINQENGDTYWFDGNTYIHDDYFVAYVIDTPNTGFYQIAYDGVLSEYVWALVEGVNAILNAKQYNVGQISVQAGYSNVQDLPSLEVTSYQLLTQAIANLQMLLNVHRDILDGDNPSINATTFTSETSGNQEHVSLARYIIHADDEVQITGDVQIELLSDLLLAHADYVPTVSRSLTTKGYVDVRLPLPIEFYSESAFASVTRTSGKIYGVYDETTGVMTFYYGDVGEGV